MTIFWDGDATICSVDLDGEHILGNITERTVREIWNSAELLHSKEMHRVKKFKDLPLCSQCDW